MRVLDEFFFSSHTLFSCIFHFGLMRHHDLWFGLFFFLDAGWLFPILHGMMIGSWDGGSNIFDATNRIWTKLLVKIRPQSYLLGIVQSLTDCIFFHNYFSLCIQWHMWCFKCFKMMSLGYDGTGDGPFLRWGNGSLADASWRWRSWKTWGIFTRRNIEQVLGNPKLSFILGTNKYPLVN